MTRDWRVARANAAFAPRETTPRSATRESRLTTRVFLEPVHENKQSKPHHVDEVPIPRHTFEREVVCGREMSA